MAIRVEELDQVFDEVVRGERRAPAGTLSPFPVENIPGTPEWYVSPDVL